jgi:hypothetical protein
VPLTGRYSIQGAQVRAGLELWAARTGAKLVLLDDGSDPGRAGRLHEQLVRRGCRLVLGPYGSDSTRVVARVAKNGVVWNHGAAADDVQRLPGVVSPPSPASRYLVALGRAVARLRPGARVAVVTGPGRFADFASQGLKQQAASLKLELVDDLAEADALLVCGSLGWEIERFRSLGRQALIVGGVSHAYLLHEGWPCSRSNLLRPPGLRWAAALKLPAHARLQVDSLLLVVAALEAQLDTVDAELGRFARSDGRSWSESPACGRRSIHFPPIADSVATRANVPGRGPRRGRRTSARAVRVRAAGVAWWRPAGGTTSAVGVAACASRRVSR